jgi:hypothetical protein
MLDGPVPPELLRRVSDFSPLVDAGERVERVAIATAPLALLAMTERYLHIVTARGTHQWCDGQPRSSLFGRVEGKDLIVRVGDVGDEHRFGCVHPAGVAARLAGELHKPFTVEDAKRAQRSAPSIADIVW